MRFIFPCPYARGSCTTGKNHQGDTDTCRVSGPQRRTRNGAMLGRTSHQRQTKAAPAAETEQRLWDTSDTGSARALDPAPSRVRPVCGAPALPRDAASAGAGLPAPWGGRPELLGRDSRQGYGTHGVRLLYGQLSPLTCSTRRGATLVWTLGLPRRAQQHQTPSVKAKPRTD